jgi:hypothetical protein
MKLHNVSLCILFYTYLDDYITLFETPGSVIYKAIYKAQNGKE